jgi:hypothetical protein
VVHRITRQTRYYLANQRELVNLTRKETLKLQDADARGAVDEIQALQAIEPAGQDMAQQDD